MALREPLLRLLPSLEHLLPAKTLAPLFLAILLAAASLGFGWLQFDAEALGLPPSAPGRILSEAAEAVIAGLWLGLTWRALRSR